MALARLWASWGVLPDVVAGHSVGEIAAAHIAGVLSLADACSLVAARGRLMQALPTGGAMLAVEATEDELVEALAGLADVGVAAVNGPRSVVASGPRETLAPLEERFRAEGRRVRWLDVSHAFHSPLMQPMIEPFRKVVEALDFQPAKVSTVSTVTGASDAAWQDPDYWIEHVLRPVRFADAVTALADTSVSRFLEIGPQGVLSALTQQSLPDDSRAVVVPSLHGNKDEAESVLTALARLHVSGTGIDWDAFYAEHAPARIDLPTYAFQQERYWTQAADAAPTAQADPLDAAFWDAVESAEPGTFAELLGVDSGSLGAVLPAMAEMRGRQRANRLLDGLRYKTDWQPVSLTEGSALSGTWLVLLPAAHAAPVLVDRIQKALDQQGVKTIPIEVGGHDRASLAAVLAESVDAETPQGVLSLLALDARDSAGHPELSQGTADTVVLAQALADAGIGAPLRIVTSGAVAATPEETADPAQAVVWGMGLSLSLDRPETWGGLVDVPVDLDDAASRRLCAALTVEGGEDRLAVRGATTYAYRMVRAALPEQGIQGESAWTPGGAVLITGGTGGLGAHVARMLAAHGARDLVLTSRRGNAAAGAAELAAELEGLGARVRIEACDVADRDLLESLLASFGEDRPLSAVFHAAGAAQRLAPLTELTLDEFAEVARAKVLGARHLDELLGDRPLDAFVLFSSGSAVWGSAGQAAYAGANAYLDGLARSRRARGRTSTAIAWGSWQGGMVDEELAAVMRRIGAPAMAPETALASLRRELVRSEEHVVVAEFDWSRFAPTYTLARPRPVLDAIPEVRALLDGGSDTVRDASGGATQLAAELAGMSPAEQSRTLLTLVRTHVGELLGYDSPSDLDPGRAFEDLGFDSVIAVDLRNRLTTATGRNLPSTMVFDYANPSALAAYLRSELCPEGEGPSGQPSLQERLAQLETTVLGLDTDELSELNVISWLRSLASRLGDSPDAAVDVGSQLESASADDVFDFIDKELGLA
ncbi:SDR family NAD(P)-dependent oxidoreductase [Streptomyces sp. NPDC006450]|uniref:SDR family NAD(P)-dependent oxidoreductase n=1 Tax=Streptomyces sp. NPDC006450 TaxID=3155458 RepID=UPI0033AEC87F